MVLDLMLYPRDEECLRLVADPVVEFGSFLRDLSHDMINTMILHGGIGLAAQQVAVHQRIFVMRTPRMSEGFHEPIVVVNPTIVAASSPSISTEGCLSLPCVHLQVQRFLAIFVKFQDLKGRTFHKTFSGLSSRCFQHELDHLDGKLIIDDPAARPIESGAAQAVKVLPNEQDEL